MCPKLTICIPIYNHARFLALQLDQLNRYKTNQSDVEFVVVDDASTDNIDDVIDMFLSSGWNTKCLKQDKNRGRAAALKRAILASSGEFVMIMDGDDAYVGDAIGLVLRELNKMSSMRSGGEHKVCGIVFGTEIQIENDKKRLNLPPNQLITNFLALRADHKIRGDLKEVVDRAKISKCLCELFDGNRRVPTSLIWARLARDYNIICSDIPIVQKVYLPEGMTQNISQLRRNSLDPLLQLYREIATSNSYRSRWYRFRAELNFSRFSFWASADDKVSLFPKSGNGTAMILGNLIGRAELFSRKFLRSLSAKLSGAVR